MTVTEQAVRADHASLEQAAQWYASLHAGGANDAQRAAWTRWLDERPEHRQAWAHIEAVSRRFEPMRAMDQRDAAAAAVQVASRGGMGRRRALAALATLAGSGLSGWLGWRYTPLADTVTAWRADYRSETGQQRDIVLADGTHVWLNTQSALDVNYDRSQRRVALKLGEMFVDTATDVLHRPFYAETRFGVMQALGTRFSVRLEPESTLLAVYEGRVRIRTANGTQAIVEHGEQRRFTVDTISAQEGADPAREAWVRGIVLAEDIPLAQLVDELGRYRHGHLGVAPEIASLKVVGRFPATDSEHALAMLERDLPVRVQRTLPWWTTLEPR
jgi:transmembrane sensor